jgi:protein translocase SecG subunit|uniref:Preprotein translocase SecG subunit n=1 Tax=Paralia sulcata TaxID=216927 RepID=UPI0022F339C8|nr:Preprotein translocase SecG subunit [Paralia sulcata]WAJ57877.1 Preprotein translocase SecG subunit [Paralia sulcata]
MLKIIWIILNLGLISLILIRTPNNIGLESFATKSNLLGSPNSAEKTLNNVTWLLILIYFVIAVKFNFSI